MGLNNGPRVVEVQVVPPSSDLYIRFWRLPQPPFTLSFMPAINTVLFAPSYLVAPTGEPVSCTSRMKGLPLLRRTGAVQVVPLSECVTEVCPLAIKSFQDAYMRPQLPLVGSLSTHMDCRSSAP